MQVSGGGAAVDAYPDHLQLLVELVQQVKVVLVDHQTARLQLPVVQLPVLHPLSHT